MLDNVYKRRISRDLPTWVENGWVNADKAEDLLTSIGRANLHGRLPTIIAMLGAVLLAFAAMTFVAANWHGIPKAGRLGILFGTLWASYGAAAWVNVRGWSLFYEAAVVLGCAVFGASIMLIAQMYHIDRHYPDGVMVWGIGTLITAALTRSSAAAIFGFALIALWTGLETVHFNATAHWAFLAAWIPATAFALFRRWNPAINAAAIALFIWLAFTVTALADAHNWPDSVAVAILAMVAAAALGGAIRFEAQHLARGNQPSYSWSTQSMLVFMALVFLFQIVCVENNGVVQSFPSSTTNGMADAWIGLVAAFAVAGAVAIMLSISQEGLSLRDALIFLIAIFGIALSSVFFATKLAFIAAFALGYFALAIMFINLGQRRDHKAAINIGFTAFSIETLYIYFETLGTLLDTAVFFLAGGVGLVVLAVLLEQVRRRLVTRRSDRASEAPA